MLFAELLLTAVGLSMDAFAVAVCKGLNMRRIDWGQSLWIALFFGGFQALMPFLGWLLGSQFSRYIERYDHWIVFILLAWIGGKMLWDALKENDEALEEEVSGRGRGFFVELTMLAVATSIDALAVGVTLALLPGTRIGFSVLVIGCTTFLLSLCGVTIGSRFGVRFRRPAQIAGGVILILIGVRILLEHLGLF